MSEPVKLQREAVAGRFAKAGDANAGLLLQRGWPSAASGEGSKAAHLRRVARVRPVPAYARAFARWKAATADSQRFYQCESRLQSRMLIGLSGGAALETGGTVSHIWGMPMIPGSSLKGLARAHAEQLLGDGHPLVQEMFGAREGDALSGVVAFHDAWWVPPASGRTSPFVCDVLTVHHQDYYTSQGNSPASDKDSPVPVPLIAVQGEFLFVIEGLRNWATLAGHWLMAALAERGAGAKSAAGYGACIPPKPPKLPAAREVWEGAKIFFDPGRKEIRAQAGNRSTAPLAGARVDEFLASLDEDLAARLKKKKLDGVGGLQVEVEKAGDNLFVLCAIVA